MNEMKKIIENGVEDWGGITSPEFKSFSRKFKNRFKKELNKIDAKITSFNVGHYFVSGFFRLANNDCIYFSVSDIRYFSKEAIMLFRKAKDEKDYTGGSNRYVGIENDMVEKMWFNFE